MKKVLKVLILISFILLSYFYGLTNDQKIIDTCIETDLTKVDPEEVHAFFGHKTFDFRHHLAYSYFVTFNCYYKEKRK
jgi:hypothetical protein